jgi:anti-sigma factor RsiW
MKCAQVVRLFGAYWDDETTQAEREWVEAHLASCSSCRKEYETFTRTLELMGSLPRVEPAPDLVERVLARARRASPAPDAVPVKSRPWVPVTAALALTVIAGSFALPWFGARNEARRETAGRVILQREPVPGQLAQLPGANPAHPAPAGGEPSAATGALVASDAGATTAVPDSLFDHNEDVEFILDPVKLQRGRATVSRPPAARSEKAIISF